MVDLQRKLRATKGLCMHAAYCLLFVLLIPSPALAEGAKLSSLWLPFINFCLYAVLLVYLYKRFGTSLVRQRSIEIRELVNRVAASLSDAENKRGLIQGRLTDVDAEKADLVKRYEEEGVAMSHAIAANAKRQSERIASDTARQIEAELQQAKKMLHNEAVQRATEIARTRIGSELSAEQDRLLRKSVIQDFVAQESS